MSRKAREKSPFAVYHVFSRSLSEILLFRDENDKEFYLRKLKVYLEKYKCSLYAYCLVDNHLHLHLDPRGFDISSFMASLNTSYAIYYNKKYKRHGPVFQGRFQSRLLDTDEYNLAVSAYIHNNPSDIKECSGKEHLYKYSSYGIYLAIHKDIHHMIDMGLMMSLFGVQNKQVFVKRYSEFVSHRHDMAALQELGKRLVGPEKNEYDSGRKVILRGVSPARVISFIADKLMITGESSISFKSKKKLLHFRALTAYVLRVYSGLGYKEICSSMYNITISACSRLCSLGYELLCKNPEYETILKQLVVS